MATVPINESEINFLANEIAKSYMTGKICSVKDFIDTYLEVVEAAKTSIREKQKMNVSTFNSVPTDFPEDTYDETMYQGKPLSF